MWSLRKDPPVAVVIVDTDEQIRGFPELERLELEGIVIVEPVEVIRYAGRGPAGPAGPGEDRR